MGAPHAAVLAPSCSLATPQDGRDLCAALSKRDASGERAFGWARRGKRVALDVASALAYLHQRHVMHFDVKARVGGVGWGGAAPVGLGLGGHSWLLGLMPASTSPLALLPARLNARPATRRLPSRRLLSICHPCRSRAT